ncbi:Metallo-dependent phosphatase [Ramaria rubella]|nr:Metallo-dependent phosphatase [Ramaria rubella]
MPVPGRRQRTASYSAIPLLRSPDNSKTYHDQQRKRSYLPFFGLAAFALLLYLLYLGLSRPSSPSGKKLEPVQGQYVRRIVAVGDLHADINNAFRVLHMANVVDANGSWSGDVDYFVQVGDIVDRGVDTIELYGWMEMLRIQARNAGGEVFSHLGNHEFMNILGDWRYVSQSEVATFGSIEQRQAAITTGPIGSAWIQNYSVTSRVPLHPSSGEPHGDYTPSRTPSALSHASLSFTHGGISPVFVKAHGTPYPSAINKLGVSLLRRCAARHPQPDPHPPAPYMGLPPGSTPAEHALYDTDGPLWYRGWAMDDEKDVCERVDGVMQKIGVRRLIMGHTPDFQKIVKRCGGKIIIIDTGISKAYGGALSALSITYSLTPILSSFPASSFIGLAKNGRGRGKWIEREDIVALYPNHKVPLVQEEREVEGDFW